MLHGRRLAAARGMAILIMAGSLSAVADGKVATMGKCTIDLPDTWSVAGENAHSPDNKVKVSITEVVEGSVSTSTEIAMGGSAVTNSATLAIVVMYSSGGGARYLAIAPSTGQACMARLEASDSDSAQRAVKAAASLKRTP